MLGPISNHGPLNVDSTHVDCGMNEFQLLWRERAIVNHVMNRYLQGVCKIFFHAKIEFSWDVHDSVIVNLCLLRY